MIIYKIKNMAITPLEFFEKNMRYIALVLLLLLVFKGVQSCNRGMSLNIKSEQYIHEIDSLKKQYVDYKEIAQDSIKRLNFELIFAKEQVKSANDKAAAVQSAVEIVWLSDNQNTPAFIRVTFPEVI